MTASADNADGPVADDPVLRFDAEWFRRTYPKLAVPAGPADGPAQFDVYVANARQFALNPNPHFEEKHYRAIYKDVARSVEDGTFWSGFHHYLRHGHSELRQPRRPTHRIAIDLRPFGTDRSDPLQDVHVRLLVRGLVRLIPTALFLLVVEPGGVEAFAEVEGANARRLPMTDHHWDMIRVLRKRAIDYLVCPYGETDLTFPSYTNIGCALTALGLASRPAQERAAVLREWRRFDGVLCASEAIRSEVNEALGPDGVAARCWPLDPFVRHGLPWNDEPGAGAPPALIAVAGVVDAVAARRLVKDYLERRPGDGRQRGIVLIDADDRATGTLAALAAKRGLDCAVRMVRSTAFGELAPALADAEAIVDAGSDWRPSLTALADALAIPVTRLDGEIDAVAAGRPTDRRQRPGPDGRATGEALLAELAATRSDAKARTVLHGLVDSTGEIEWLGLRVAPSPRRRTLSMAIRFPHDVPDRRMRLEQWCGGELQDRIAIEPGATMRIEVPLPVDGGVFDWRLVTVGEQGKWHLVHGGADRRMQCLHAFVREEGELVLAAPVAGTGTGDAALDRANALIAAYEPLKQELVDELFRLTVEQPAMQLKVPKLMFATAVSRPRVLHVVKPSFLDPALLFHGSTKDILGRREYFANRGFLVDELVVPPKEEREEQAIRALMARRGVEYDAIFIEYLLYPDLMLYLRDRYPAAKILVRGHNAEVLHRLDTIAALWATSDAPGWRERLRAIRIRKQVRTVRRYLQDELRCARLADTVVSISDWESKHYWPWLIGSRRTVTVPYFVPAAIQRCYPPMPRQRRIVALSSVGPGPLVQHALQNFKRLVTASAARLPGWTFAATGEFDVDDVIRHRNINFAGTVADPIEELRGAAAMALLSPLGYGFKTKIMDAVTAGAYTLLPKGLMRRVPDELRPYCIVVDPSDASSFVAGANRAMADWPAGDPNRLLRERAYRVMDSVFGISASL